MDEIILKLTMEEAKALATICHFVAGRAKETRRGLIDSVSHKLFLNGIKDNVHDVSGEIRFEKE